MIGYLDIRSRCGAEKTAMARRMRKQPTPAEERFWELCRGKQFGVRFKRQQVIRGWIVDFYCPQHGLVVEFDGGYHDTPEQRSKDQMRDGALRGLGFTILRFPNALLLDSPEKVVVAIFDAMATAKPVHEAMR